MVDRERICIQNNIKYLGLTLSGRLEKHFAHLALKIKRVTILLRRLLLSVAGSEDETRTPYMGMVKSIALYGASVWFSNL